MATAAVPMATTIPTMVNLHAQMADAISPANRRVPTASAASRPIHTIISKYKSGETPVVAFTFLMCVVLSFCF